MNKDLTARIRKLGLKFCSIGDYLFAGRVGYSREELERLAEKIKPELNFVLPGIPGDAQVDFQRLDLVDDSDLKRWEQRVEKMTGEIWADETYQEVLRAYNANDQEAISQLMPSIFGFDEKLKKPRTLYHGITPRKITIGDFFLDFDEKPSVKEYITPDEHIDLALKIEAKGLLPSVGEHQSTDENLRPIFTVPDHEETYGLLFFELNPLEHGYAVFVGVDNEHLIYTPRLNIPLKLCLKSTEYVESDRVENTISAGERPLLREYRNLLEGRLRERDVPFCLVEPYYMSNL